MFMDKIIAQKFGMDDIRPVTLLDGTINYYSSGKVTLEKWVREYNGIYRLYLKEIK
jgi:hypothetical protein